MFSNLLWVVFLPLHELSVCELLNPVYGVSCLNLLQIRESYLIICLSAGDQAECLKDQQM